MIERAADRVVDLAKTALNVVRDRVAACVRRTVFVFRGAYRFVKAFCREYVRAFFAKPSPLRLRSERPGASRQVVEIRPFLKITPRIRDAIPTDLAA